MASMEEILTGVPGKPEEPEVEAKEEKPEQEAAAATPEPKPEEAVQEEPLVSEVEQEPKGGKEAAPPAVEKEPHTVPLAGYLDEREKRQKLERELALLRKPAEPDAAPDFYDDPEAALKERERAYDEKLLKTKLEMSQAMAQSQHDDFDEVLGKFNDAWQKDETLQGRARIIWNDALTQPHPAEFVYNAVKRELALQEVSDPAELRKKIEAEIRAELQKETETKEEPKDPGESIPESLADERSVGSRAGPKWSGPTPLGEIIKSA